MYAQKLRRLIQNVLPHPPSIVKSSRYTGPDRRGPTYSGPERRRENLTGQRGARPGDADLSEDEIKVLLKKN